MKNINKYLQLYTQIENVKNQAIKTNEKINFISTNQRSISLSLKLFLFYLIPLILISNYINFFSKDIAMITDFSYFLLSCVFILLDFLFVKFFVFDKKIKKIIHTIFIFLLVSFLFSFLLDIEWIFEFFVVVNTGLRVLLSFLFFGFLLQVTEYLCNYILFKPNDYVLRFFNESRKLKSKLRELEKNKKECIESIIDSEKDISFILHLQKNDVDTKKETLLFDIEKPIEKEAFKDIISAFVSTQNNEKENKTYLDILFENKFKKNQITND